MTGQLLKGFKGMSPFLLQDPALLLDGGSSGGLQELQRRDQSADAVAYWPGVGASVTNAAIEERGGCVQDVCRTLCAMVGLGE